MEKSNTPEIPELVVTSNDVTPPPHKSMLKYIVMGLVVLAVGLVGGYYFSQSSKPIVNSVTPSPTSSPEASDEMEGWKSFVNEEYGFEYPNNWYIDTQGETEDYVRLQNFNPKTAPQRGYDPEQDKGLFSVSFYSWGQNSKANTIEELKKELNSEKECFYVGDPAGERISINEQSKTIGSNSIYSRETRCSLSPVSTTQKEYFIFDGKGEMVKIIPGLDAASDMTLIDQILSTFEFVE